ncbi:MAG: cupin domain-containing protein [Acidimicrobiia bacterium]|nr:cupin domain-containing protein [Acidimicrobiia bacterium]
MSDEPVSKVQRERRPAPAECFDGHVEMEAIHEGKETTVRQGRVHFHDGARTHPHLHVGAQLLYFVEGRGIAQTIGGELLECDPGDIVHVPAGTRHIHGAAEGHDAVHIAITTGETIWSHDPRYPG